MAFQAAKLTRYQLFLDATGTTIVRIFAGGEITDDAVPGSYYTEYWIHADEMATLPQPDRVTYSFPGSTDASGNVDPHVLAVRAILAREAKKAHAAWMEQRAQAAAVVVVERSAEALLATPAISPAELPEDEG
jgi:hypothetical protein